jgi:chemotaxis protein CheD
MESTNFSGAASPTVFIDREFNSEAAKIGPGQYFVTKQPMIIATVLGSCVSACLRDPLAGVGGMNHFMLPERGGDPDSHLSSSARYGAYAMEVLINHLLSLGADKRRLEAKIFGAGRVLVGVTDIGKRNAEFADGYLKREDIRVVARDLGGTHARKVYFFPHTGRVLVKELRRLDNDTLFTREQNYASKLDATPVAGEVDLF